MGAAESKADDDSSINVFSDEEKISIKDCFAVINNTNGFKAHLQSLGEQVTSNLEQYISNLGNKQHSKKDGTLFSFLQFQIFLAQVFRGSVTEKFSALRGLCCGRKVDDIPGESLYQALLQISKAYRKLTIECPVWSTWLLVKDTDQDARRFTLGLLHDLLVKGCSKREAVPVLEIPENVSYSDFDLEEWMSRSPLLLHVLEVVFTALFPLDSNKKYNQEKLASMLPIPVATTTPCQTILDAYSLLFLTFNLTKDMQTEWRLVYNNSIYGDSFTRLVSHILTKGPSYIVIKDKSGHIFGGFASQKWELNSRFYGTESSFLFTVSPQYGTYHATTYNSNFMYLNHGQQTLPNGLGMGGQFDYFGLWIDQSFNNGHSKAQPRCTTYGSPQLSGKVDFEVEAIEVWELGPLPKQDSDDEDEEAENKKKSILDSNTEAKAMLALIGKEQVSLGLRESDDEELTEEMKRKMNTIPSLI